MADVSAKDGSQETLVNLVASMIGIWILSHLPEQFFIFLYALLVFVHLFANYSAVKALRFNSLNENRLALIIMTYNEEKRIPSPDEVNKLEPVFFKNLIKAKYGFRIKMGFSFDNVSEVMILNEECIQYLSSISRRENFFTYMDTNRHTNWTFLKEEANSIDEIKAYFYSCCVGRYFYEWFPECYNNTIYSSKSCKLDADPFGKFFSMMYLKFEDQVFRNCETFISRLQETEWMVNSNLLLIGPWRGSWENKKVL